MTVIRHTHPLETEGVEELTAHHHPPETEIGGAREVRATPLPHPPGKGDAEEITLHLPRKSAVMKNHRLVDVLEKRERGEYPLHPHQENLVVAQSHRQLEKGAGGEGEVKTIPHPHPHPQLTEGVGEILRPLGKGTVTTHLPADKRGKNHHHHQQRGEPVVDLSHHNHRRDAADNNHQGNNKGLQGNTFDL